MTLKGFGPWERRKMDQQAPFRTLPMKTVGTQHFIERTYREGGSYQWVRETFINALEADATRVEFGIEWQAVEALGVYRRVIADNGRGMTSEELVEFFNTFGGGGKPIGGVHENFGVGAKTSLLPWNRYGMVVVSWVDGDPSMIWVRQDPDTGEYGLLVVEAEDPDSGESSLEAVYYPFEDEDHGCDWEAIKPDWMGDNGTVIVLLGNDPHDDTVLGDPTRNEGDIKGISSYLNRRLWEMPSNVDVVVDELRTTDRSKWPRSEDEGHGPQPKVGYDRRTNPRSIEGARHFIEYPVKTFKKGGLRAAGTVALSDGTEIDWYLWEGDRPAVQSYAAIGGYIAAVYSNELYDFTSHASTYRSFGVSELAVRGKLWLIIRPPMLGEEDNKHGVYPRTDRNALLLKGGPAAGQPLPINDWAAEFADQMPDDILSAIKTARGGEDGSLNDPVWRDRLAERFGSRWRITKLRANKKGRFSVDATQEGTRPRVKRPKKIKRAQKGGGGGRGGEINIGTAPGTTPATKVRVAGGIPHYRPVGADSVDEGMLAAWQPNDPEHPEGVVLLNVEHPVLADEIEHWQAQYADHLAEQVGRDVIDAYGQIIVAKLAHSEHLKGVLPSQTVENDLRSSAALTMALLGLIAEEAVISTRIGGKYGKRRSIA
jgi:hypothetical protein